MTSIKALCKHGIILQNGLIIDQGDIDPIVTHYLRGDSIINNYKKWEQPSIGQKGFHLLEIGIRKKGGEFNDVMRVDHDLELIIRYKLDLPISPFWITLHLKNEQGEKIFSFGGGGRCYDKTHNKGEYVQTCIIPKNFLNWGNYSIDFMAFKQENHIEAIGVENDIISFTLANKLLEIGSYMGREPGDVTPKFEFYEHTI